MEEQRKGPFEVRGRLTHGGTETGLGVWPKLEDAKQAAQGRFDSKHWHTVTVIDLDSQDCVLHLPTPDEAPKE